MAANSPAARVAVLGTLNLDLVWHVPALPRPGETIIATAVQRAFGGKGANQAVAAARQGAHVTLVGALGDDAGGRAYREHLRQERIATDLIATTAEAATGTAHVYLDPHGENLIVVDRGANAQIDPTTLAHVLPRTDLLLVQLECELATAVKALQLANARGVRCMLNASPANAAFPWSDLAIYTVIVNELECGECFGRTPSELCALSLEARQRWLDEFRVQHVVITQGAEPTLHFSAEEFHRVPTFAVVPRDTVGAGDTFAGALAAQLASGAPWEPALRYANVAAALSTLAVGAQSAMPRRAEVDAALETLSP